MEESVKKKTRNNKNYNNNNNNNVKMEYAVLKCGICEEGYSEDRVPKLMACGHSMCEVCTSQKLTHYRHCPDCHTIYKSEDLKDMPNNYPVLKLLRSHKSKDLFGSIEVSHMAFPSLDQEIDSWKCPAHESTTAFLCITCSVWVCRDCLIVDHPQIPRGNCRIVSVNKGLDILRKEFKRKTKICVKKVENIKQNLDRQIQLFDTLTKYCPDEWKHKRVVLNMKGLLDGLKNEAESTVSSAMTQMKKDLRVVKTTLSPEEITTCSKNLANSETNLLNHMDQEKIEKKTFRQDALLHLRMDLKSLVEGQQVYVVHQGSLPRPMWAQVSQAGGRVMVSSLRDGNPPEGGLIIPYEYVREMVHKNYPSVFFELGTKDKSQGIVHIRLFKDCLRVRNMVLFCTGEEGLCYRGTSLFKESYDPMTVRGGDFENNDGTGSNIDVDGDLNESFPNEKELKGNFGHFSVYYDSLSKFSFPAYIGGGIRLGIFTEGSEVIQSLSESESVSEMVVRECGIFLPGKIEEDIKESLPK